MSHSSKKFFNCIFFCWAMSFFAHVLSDHGQSQCPFYRHSGGVRRLSKKVSRAQEFTKPPRSYGGNFLLGDYPHLRRDSLRYLDFLLNKYQADIVELDVPGAGLFMNRWYVVFSPELAQEILLDQSGTFVKGDTSKRVQSCLFAPEGTIWMDSTPRWELLNRTLFEGPFNPACFPNRYSDIFYTNFIWFVERLQTIPQPFDLYQEVTYCTMRMMAQAFFDYVLSDEQLMAVTKAFKERWDFMKARETSLINVPLSLPTRENLRFKKYTKCFYDVLNTIIQQAPREIVQNGITYPTIIKVLQDHRDPGTNKPLTSEEIVSHIATLFFAGHDTTANFTTMLFYRLHRHPEWRERIGRELQEKYGDRSWSFIPLGDLQEYTLFKNEVLRLYPSVPAIVVNNTCPIALDNYLIPQGSSLYLSLATIAKNPRYFKNPTTFNPDRFTPGNADYTPTTPTSFMPFSFGPRRCLGQWFAQAEVQALVTHFLQNNITIEVVDDTPEPVELFMTIIGQPSRTIKARVHVPEHSALKKSSVYTTMALTDHVMTIIDIRHENRGESVKTFRLGAVTGALPFAYRAGDHLEIINVPKFGAPVVRHYSVSSAPTQSKEWLEISIKKEPGNTFSTWLHKHAQVGDQLIVRAPVDDGVISYEYADHNRPLVLISGGIGSTPMMSLVREFLSRNWPGEIYYLHSAKTAQELLFHDELQDYAHWHPYFTYTVTLTQEPIDSAWSGKRGRIDTTLLRNLPKNSCIYLCGSGLFCKNMRTLLQEQFGFASDAIHELSFGSVVYADVAQQAYTLSEVAQHNKLDDAWIVINGIVYDVTLYLAQHPGFDIIIDYLGKDATRAFNMTPHSAQAKRMLHEDERIIIKGVVT